MVGSFLSCGPFHARMATGRHAHVSQSKAWKIASRSPLEDGVLTGLGSSASTDTYTAANTVENASPARSSNWVLGGAPTRSAQQPSRHLGSAS